MKSRTWRSTGVRTQVLVATLLLLTLPTVLLGVAAVSLGEDQVRRSSMARGEAHTASLADALGAHVNASKEVLITVAEAPGLVEAVATADGDAMWAAARAAYHGRDDFRVVWVQPASGAPEAYPFATPVEGPNGEWEPLFAEVMATNGPVVGPVFVGNAPLEAPFAVVAVPVRDDGRVVGAVAGALDLERFGERLASPTPGRTLMIVDGDGDAIYHPDRDVRRNHTDLSHLAGVSRLQQDSRGAVETGDVVAFYAREPTTGWGVVVHEDAASLFGAAGFLEAFLVGFILLVGAATAALAVVLSRRTTGPLLALRDAARRLSAGDWSARAPEEGSREAAEVARAFNAMARDLEEKRERLEAYAAELEDRVARRTVELAERNRELEAFNHTVAHDLKEPLRGIHTYADIILEDHGDDIPGDAADYVGRIRDRSDRMGSLLEGLLRVARLGRDHEGGPVDMDAVVDDALLLLETRVDDRGAVVEVDHPLPDAVGNPDLLMEVFVNLVGNALKHNDSPTPRVRVWGRVEGGEAHYRVEDNGIGIPPALRDEVFGLFRKLHPQEDYGGTGVGLAIVKRVVERHGGRVWITDPAARAEREAPPGEPGGTVVHVALPAATPAPPRAAAGPP